MANYSVGHAELRSDDGHTKVSIAGGTIQVTPDSGTTEITMSTNSISVTPDGGTTVMSVGPGLITLTAAVVNVVGVFKVNGVVVTVP